MSWQAAVLAGLAVVLVAGFAWYERTRPPARLVALVAALAALAIAGRLALAPAPNVVATTDVALITGYALGGPPGFAVGALAAPVSNIWLGQGPWTVWQMAGWGLAGLGGAWLAAVAGRGLGRWGLAIACGLAGLAYGALLDLSVMVTYGGEQSLDRYLALSARGVPFNVAHAAGNFAIAFVAGPALVRMISRYRTRLEFRWHPAGVLPVALIVAGLAGAALAPGVRDGVARAAEPALARSGAEAGARWLVRAQNADGGFAASPGGPSNPAITGWAVLGLEAAGRNPLDVRSGGRSAVSYLRAEVGRLRSAGDLERTILALAGAGIDPRRFGGRELVAELRARRDRDGSLDGQVNLSAFYVLAMRAAGTDPAALGRPARWLRAARNGDGGWGFRPGVASDPDSTAAALQALAAAGAGGRARAAGVRWLRRAQRPGGGWALAGGGAVNAQSTAWAVQGLVAAGGAGTAVERALGYLDSLRAADGRYRYSRAADQTPVWVTAQALLAVERRPFPLAAVAREPSGREAGGGAEPAPAAAPPPAAPPIPPQGGADLSGPVVSAAGAGAPGLGGLSDPAGVGAAAGGGGEGGAGAEVARGGKDGGGPAPPAAGGLGELAEGVLGASTRPAAPAADDEPVTPYVAGGLGLLALALGAGFLWYRRTLP